MTEYCVDSRRSSCYIRFRARWAQKLGRERWEWLALRQGIPGLMLRPNQDEHGWGSYASIEGDNTQGNMVSTVNTWVNDRTDPSDQKGDMYKYWAMLETPTV